MVFRCSIVTTLALVLIQPPNCNCLCTVIIVHDRIKAIPHTGQRARWCHATFSRRQTVIAHCSALFCYLTTRLFQMPKACSLPRRDNRDTLVSPSERERITGVKRQMLLRPVWLTIYLERKRLTVEKQAGRCPEAERLGSAALNVADDDPTELADAIPNGAGR